MRVAIYESGNEVIIFAVNNDEHPELRSNHIGFEEYFRDSGGQQMIMMLL